MTITFPHIKAAENFHGFGTVHFYEQECNKAGHTTRRIPCVSPDGVSCIALIAACPEPCSKDARDALDIITADETDCFYSGAVRHDGSDLTSTLLRLGYLLTTPAEDAPELSQLSLF